MESETPSLPINMQLLKLNTVILPEWVRSLENGQKALFTNTEGPKAVNIYVRMRKPVLALCPLKYRVLTFKRKGDKMRLNWSCCVYHVAYRTENGVP